MGTTGEREVRGRDLNMALRPELQPKKIDRKRVAKLTALIRLLVDRSEQHQDISEPLEEFHQFTGSRQFDAADFRMLYGASSPEELAEDIALGEPREIGELSREELVELVGLAMEPNSKQTFYLNLLERKFPTADLSDLIFWPDRERTETETADELLHRQRLFEHGGVDAVKAYLTGLAEAVMADPNSPLWAQTWAEGYLRPG